MTIDAPDHLDSPARISAEDALRAVAAGTRTAQQLGCRVTVVVIDPTGSELALVHMDGTTHESADIAHARAFIAATFDIETARLTRSDGANKPPGAESLDYAGGAPVHREGRMVAAVGIAGGDADQNARCASAAVETLAAEQPPIPRA